jgi:hypothetical protein
MSDRTEELQQSLRTFLEHDPLYRDISIPSGFVKGDHWPSRITYYCQLDRADKTFHQRWEYARLEAGISNIHFKCGDCETQELLFIVRAFDKGDASVGFAEKIGQYPPWRIAPSADITRFLGDQTDDLYRKALVSLSQGYGLGALAYLRRVVEDSARALVNLLAAFTEQEGGPPKAVTELRTLAEGKEIETMLKRAADLFPSHLRPGNTNPLATIYDAASIAIHREDDSTCAKKANAIVKALEYVIPTMSRQIKGKTDYLEAIEDLKP